ncbi:MAG: hypothetical protein ACYS22_16480, partial [Planctomycetota bacterium]
EDDEGDYEEAAKNGPLLSPEELFAIKEIPDLIWFGPPGGEEGSEEGGLEALMGLIGGGGDEGGEGVQTVGLFPMLTCWGTERLNPNTMPRELFSAVLPEKDTAGQELDRDAIIERIDQFRTGRVEGEEEPPPVSEDGVVPGEDFAKVDDLTKIDGLSSIFPRRGRGGGAAPAGSGGTAGNEPAPEPLPKDRLTVVSQDFVIIVHATRNDLRRSFEALLRRGEEQFYVLMWRELTP